MMLKRKENVGRIDGCLNGSSRSLDLVIERSDSGHFWALTWPDLPTGAHWVRWTVWYVRRSLKPPSTLIIPDFFPEQPGSLRGSKFGFNHISNPQKRWYISSVFKKTGCLCFFAHVDSDYCGQISPELRSIQGLNSLLSMIYRKWSHNPDIVA